MLDAKANSKPTAGKKTVTTTDKDINWAQFLGVFDYLCSKKDNIFRHLRVIKKSRRRSQSCIQHGHRDLHNDTSHNRCYEGPHEGEKGDGAEVFKERFLQKKSDMGLGSSSSRRGLLTTCSSDKQAQNLTGLVFLESQQSSDVDESAGKRRIHDHGQCGLPLSTCMESAPTAQQILKWNEKLTT